MSKTEQTELKTWFLGPKGESAQLLRNLMDTVIERAGEWRRNGSDKATTEVSHDKHLEAQVGKLLKYLEPRTVPAFSSRYQAHMGWDLMLPGIVGQMVGLLFPSNNVAYEGSPGTTVLEMLVAYDLCRMLGYPDPKAPEIKPWGHLVAGGTIGNVEALWAARNLKFLPLALKETLGNMGAILEMLGPEPKQNAIAGLKALGAELADMDLLNVPIDKSLAFPARVKALLPDDNAQAAFDVALNQNSVNVKGLHHFLRDDSPKILLSHDNHYSLEKAAALLGLGQDSLDFVEVDRFGRMDTRALENQLNHWADRRAPVIAVVANLGSTELGAVDDLARILDLRNDLRAREKGRQLDFMVHVDAAFGGYHASLLREDFPLELQFPVPKSSPPSLPPSTEPTAGSVPEIGLSQYVMTQYEALPRADSIAVDPHKLGFLPYPGGAICYRNSALRDLTKFSAPYLGAVVPQGIGQIEERTDQLVGVFGIEGSRAGGAATAVFLAHSLLRPSKNGYGRLCGQQLYTSKRVFAALMSLNEPDSDFRVAVAGAYPGSQKDQERLVAIGRQSDSEIKKLKDNLSLLEECGPDLNLLCYLFNFRVDGEWNRDLVWLNVFNMLIYGQLKLQPEPSKEPVKQDLIVAQTIFSGREGTAFMGGLLMRAGVEKADDELAKADLFALRSAEWNPWLTEEDLELATFKGALLQAAATALPMILENIGNSEKGVSAMRRAGASVLVIATGIAATLAMQKAGQSSQGISQQQIGDGVEAFQQDLQKKGLSQIALNHFANPP